MIQKDNNLVQGWVTVTDSTGRTTLESRWFEVSHAAAPTHVVHAA
ncbi:hypothetical protein [Nocardioides sp.]